MKPFQLLIKPAGPDCNLQCTYCFYRRAEALFPPGKHRMKDNLLEEMIKQHMELRFPQSVFSWQGGEPALCGLNFYKRVVELQMKYGVKGQMVGNSFQTNGSLLDDKWGEFFAQYKFFVGLSLDGPKRVHDSFRKGNKGGSWKKVMRAGELLSKHGVEFNILSVVTRTSENMAGNLFQWFLDKGFKYLQFIPCVESLPDGRMAPYTVTPGGYGRFLSELFDLWWDKGRKNGISIRTFDAVLEYLITGRPAMCVFSPCCDGYLVVEHDGGVYPCDFFVRRDKRLGNLLETPLDKLYESKAYKNFGRDKGDFSPDCRRCEFVSLCNGGCQKDRLSACLDRTYLCPAYKTFFNHTLERLKALAEDIKIANGFNK